MKDLCFLDTCPRILKCYFNAFGDNTLKGVGQNVCKDLDRDDTASETGKVLWDLLRQLIHIQPISTFMEAEKLQLECYICNTRTVLLYSCTNYSITIAFFTFL